MEFHPRSTQSELFELLDRLQSARLDDQRCELPTSGKQTGGKIRESDSRQNSSKQMLQRILKHPPPYPMVALTNQCAYWTEPNSEHSNSVTQPPLVTCGPTHEEDSAKMYRLHFCGYEHYNFCANITSDTNNLSDQASLSSTSSHTQQQNQPLVISIKICSANDENNNGLMDEEDPDGSMNRHVRVILRSSDKTVHQVMRWADVMPPSVSSSSSSSDTTTTRASSGYNQGMSRGSCHQGMPSTSSSTVMIEAVMSHLGMPPTMPVMFPGISDLITAFDEHCITNKFKFGIIYQKFGQVTEEAIFGNQTHSPAMEEFMQLLGQKVRLSEHTGYRGGLDVRHGHTGTFALFEKYQGNEIMFHVSTLLPYVESDDQQLQRKCHIGNDIVSIVFQEVNTPFSPDMIASHFLHAYILVQPIDPCTSITRYRVSVVAQRDVPGFGPPLPNGSTADRQTISSTAGQSAIFDKGLAFKDFLLAKLINGERACYRASKFQALHQRTRATLLVNLAKELREQTMEYIHLNYNNQSSRMLSLSGPTGSNSSQNNSSSYTGGLVGLSGILKESSKSPSPSSSRLFTSVKRALKHVGSTKHEFQRHASAGSLSEVVNLEAVTANENNQTTSTSSSMVTGSMVTASRKNTTSSTVSTEDQSIKADSGHGDSDNSFPSSPQLSQCRKKLSTSQPHLSTLSDLSGGHPNNISNTTTTTTVDTSCSVEADDIIYEPRNSRPRMIQRRPALQLPKPSSNNSTMIGPSIDPDCHTVISGAVTTIPVGGSPTSTTSSSASASSHGSGSSDRASSSSAASSSANVVNGGASVTRLHQDISRLRVDKLELLRQALSAQHEVRQLRQREAQLETDLALAAAEIRRLKSQLKKQAANQQQQHAGQVHHASDAAGGNGGAVSSTSTKTEVVTSAAASNVVVRPPIRSARKTVHMQIPL